MESKSPRGGVAVYKNAEFNFTVDVLCDSLRDCVIVEVKNSYLVIAAQYIPPSNSVYYDDIYMENLSLIHEKYKSSHLLITGDLNTRVGMMDYNNPLFSHNINPDTIINTSGSKLLRWIDEDRK